MSSYEISKSSLFSLKAEILRKEEDLARVKQENVEKIKSIKKKSLELKNKGVEARQLNDLDSEEQDLLKLSKSKLEAKSKLYDQLSGISEENEEVNRRYLVRFDKKSKVPAQLDPDICDTSNVAIEIEEEERHLSDYYDEDIDPSNEWVEYTDCLGRSRKCLRKDLEYFMSKDADLKQVAGQKQQTPLVTLNENCQEMGTSNTNEVDKKEESGKTPISQDSSEMVSTDMRRELLRTQWELEEEELRNRADIHYQNVLFNEARQHGVGYYAFSKDEEERAKQQEALKQLRVQTEQQQKKAQDLKALREKQMAARMKAARNRKRARLGLPPEEDEPLPTPDLEKKSKEEENKKIENAKVDETEKLLMEARKRHVRPWDVGKEGVPEFYQMTQEEWNDKKRKERPTEFAPPTVYSKREFSSMVTLEDGVEDSRKSLRFSTIGPKVANLENSKLRNLNPYKNVGPSSCVDKQLSPEVSSDNSDRLMKDFIQSEAFPGFANSPYGSEDSVRKVDHGNRLNNYRVSTEAIHTMEPTPIVNEIEEVEFDDAPLADNGKSNNTFKEKERSTKRGVEIPPPPIFEYFGPSDTKKSRNSLGQVNIEDSIEAGLKFLRNQAERKKRSGDSGFHL